MSEEKQRIVVRRVHANRDGAHGGGGWKIAYADFMTAMMAFFLVMWLLSSATPKQREGVAEHFRMPLKVVLEGGKKSSTSASVIPGGGTDSIRIDGEVKLADGRDDSSDAKRLEEMKQRLDALIENSPAFQQFRSQLLVDITAEGLRLQIVDSDNRPMFDLASARVVPHMRSILRELAPMLNDWPNKMTLSGHTDSILYAGGEKFYSNWELSADRANASRRELAAGGLSEAKVLRVMGLSDSMHLDKAVPRNPINRRISIIVLNQRTQQQIERENGGTMPSIDPGAVAIAALRAPAAVPAASRRATPPAVPAAQTQLVAAQ
jgi:chemotaxis protein MotB